MASVKELVNLIAAGENIFISGAGGTGKSTLLKELFASLKATGITCGLTATTGSAAVSIGGVTIHSWTGIRLGDKELKQHYAEMLRSKARKNWRTTKVLIVDEVSMLGMNLFEKLNTLGQWIRMNENKPFGGLQLVLCGDMCQLPPINDDYIFKSKIWNTLDFNYIVLEHPWRFQNDIDYFYLLQRMRKMKLTGGDIQRLEERKRAYVNLMKETKEDDERSAKKGLPGGLSLVEKKIKPTRLFSKRIDVDRMNKDELDKLPGKEFSYIAKDAIKAKNRDGKIELYQKLVEQAIPTQIFLKDGSQVILTWNLDVEHGLCNGSRGIVTECLDEAVRVLFKNGMECLIEPNIWTIENEDALFARSQIPLILGWSYTIHRAQGQTLDSAIVNLRDVFCNNQAYVAMSRCKSMDSLYIVDYDIRKMAIDQCSIEFESQIRGEDEQSEVVEVEGAEAKNSQQDREIPISDKFDALKI